MEKILSKCDETLSTTLQIAPQKGVLADDLDAEVERLYSDHVAVPRRLHSRVGQPGNRATIRAYCTQVFKQAHIWDKLRKSVRVAEFTFPGDPSRLDYSYRRNGTRGFVHTLSVSRAPQEAKSLSYNARHIAQKTNYPTEFTAVTDVSLTRNNDRHRFVIDTLREVGVETVPMEGLAVWVAKAPSLAAAVKDFARMLGSTRHSLCTTPSALPRESVMNNRLRGCSDFAPCPLVLIQAIALARVAARAGGC